MKYCRVSIKKTKPSGATVLSYPDGYDARDHDVILYQDPHAGSARPDGAAEAVEHAITAVPDDYTFPEGTEELTQTEAETILETWINNDESALGVLTASEKTDAIAERKSYGQARAAEAVSQAGRSDLPPPGPPENTYDPTA